MPKMKSKRGAVKRFKISSSGKVVRHHANASHILTIKNKKRKRRLRQADTIRSTHEKSIRTLVQV